MCTTGTVFDLLFLIFFFIFLDDERIINEKIPVIGLGN